MNRAPAIFVSNIYQGTLEYFDLFTAEAAKFFEPSRRNENASLERTYSFVVMLECPIETLADLVEARIMNDRDR